jgi:hypothetical protein
MLRPSGQPSVSLSSALPSLRFSTFPKGLDSVNPKNPANPVKKENKSGLTPSGNPKKSTAAAPHPSQDKAAADFFSPFPNGESWKYYVVVLICRRR